MSTLTTGDSAPAADAPSVTSNHLQERLAEAACYAVLRRVAPALRHDVAGFMQPVGMLMMVLQRRVQVPEPDMLAIAKNVASVSALTKEATTGCMNAMGWIALRDDASVGLHAGVDEAIKLLSVEVSGRGMQMVNDLPDGAPHIPEHYLRSLLMGALLAFCDQATGAGTLHIGLESGSGKGKGNGHGNVNGNGSAAIRLMLRSLPGGVVDMPPPADSAHKYRSLDWPDVEAMAGVFGVAMTRGKDWVILDLPNAAEGS